MQGTAVSLQLLKKINMHEHVCVPHRHTWPERPGHQRSSGALVATPAGSRGC